MKKILFPVVFFFLFLTGSIGQTYMSDGAAYEAVKSALYFEQDASYSYSVGDLIKIEEGPSVSLYKIYLSELKGKSNSKDLADLSVEILTQYFALNSNDLAFQKTKLVALISE